MIRLTRAQIREIDHRAIDRYGIPGIVLMENAACAVRDVACDRMLGGDCTGEVLILCGGGNNGGDGLAVARHLHNRGMEVQIGLFFDPASFQGDALINWSIVQAMGLPWALATGALIRRSRPRLVVDAIFGTGLNQVPRDPFPSLLAALEEKGAPILAIDLPTGLDADTGEPFEHCIRATHTVTLVAEKAGFTNPVAGQYLGEVTVGDIGCPRELIEEVAREVHV